MYSNAAGIIPVVQTLLGKGTALGTVLAFMMPVIALTCKASLALPFGAFCGNGGYRLFTHC
jgi:uncharacterized protein